MTTTQIIITIAAVILGTMCTRFLPFIIFRDDNTPEFIKYLGTVLPFAVIGLLVVYCLKDAFSGEMHGIPEMISVLFICVLHAWRRNSFLSIGLGTVLYMMLVQYVF